MKNKTLFLTGIMICFCIGLSFAQSGYLKLGDIAGESTERGHKDWIVIEGFNQALEKSPPATGATRRRGSVVMADVVVTKKLDKSSPKLMEKCANGKVIPEVELEMVAKDGRTYYKVTLANVKISSVQTSTFCDPECEVMDEFTMSYSKITWEYWDSQGNKVTTTYNAQTNN